MGITFKDRDIVRNFIRIRWWSCVAVIIVKSTWTNKKKQTNVTSLLKLKAFISVIGP